MTKSTAWHELIAAACAYAASHHYDYVHPENPQGDAELELKTEMVDSAVDAYVAAREQVDA